MNKKWLVVVVLVAVLGVFGLTGCEQGSVSTGEIGTVKVTSQQEGIWVTGQGEVSVTPDIATIRVGVEAQDDSVAAAREQAAAAMEEVMDALSSNGIADKDIQTDYFSIYQTSEWNRETEKEVVTGYRVVNTVTVTIRDIEKVGTVIDEVTAAGEDLTRINNINFSVDDPSDYYEEARGKAMADAKEKAEQLASLSGAKLGNVTYVSEGSYSTPYVQKASGIMYDETASYTTSISPGELDISVSLQVAYDIN
ncbi:MAG: SIMPL domain-containing protein [Dehalococcoidales bacterium]|nr:SIMPL domain-containing protein [Dehalococcoidales bacterium]